MGSVSHGINPPPRYNEGERLACVNFHPGPYCHLCKTKVHSHPPSPVLITSQHHQTRALPSLGAGPRCEPSPSRQKSHLERMAAASVCPCYLTIRNYFIKRVGFQDLTPQNESQWNPLPRTSVCLSLQEI